MFKGWRTIIWNLANAVVAVVEMLPTAAYQMPDSWVPFWLAAYIIGNVILRVKTTTPVGQSE